MSTRDIIVVGASCGGLAALTKLLGGFPGDLNASVLIALHTSPQSRYHSPTSSSGARNLRSRMGSTGNPSNQGMSTWRLPTII